MKFLVILLFIAYWILAGAIAFLIEAKIEGITEFRDDEKKGFIASVMCGFLSLFFIIGIYLKEKLCVKLLRIIKRTLEKMNSNSVDKAIKNANGFQDYCHVKNNHKSGFRFENGRRQMKGTVAKYVILLCKSWYNKELYPSKLDALKQYYRKTYSDKYEEYLSESFLLKTVISDAMKEIVKNYPDRLSGFINEYLLHREDVYGILNKENQDYDYQMFYRIVEFFEKLQIRGDGLIEKDTREYFADGIQDSGSQMQGENLPWHCTQKRLAENII